MLDPAPSLAYPLSRLVIVSAFNTLHFGIIKEAPSPAPQLLSGFLSLCVCVCVFISVTPALSEKKVGGALAWLCPQREGAAFTGKGVPSPHLLGCLPSCR